MNILRQLMDDPHVKPPYGDILTAEEWKVAANNSIFVPYDGDGYWAGFDSGQCYMDRGAPVWDDKLNPTPKPDWATHVVWFNK